MKRVLAIFVVALLLTTYFIPLTSVQADVTVDSNNEILLDSTSYSLFRKLAALSTIGDLTVNGVSSYTIEDVSSVDDFIDSYLGQIEDTIIENQNNIFDGVAWTNVNELNDYINKKAYELAYNYQMPNVSSDMLSDWFNLNLDYKVEYKPNYSFKGIYGLSRFNGGSSTNPDDNYDVFIRNISGLTINGCDLLSANLAYSNRTWNNRTSYSYYKPTTFNNGFVVDGNSYINMYASQPITLYINGSDSVGWTMSTTIQRVTPWAVGSNWRPLMSQLYIWDSNTFDYGLSTTNYSDSGLTSHNSDSLTTMFNWLNLYFRHCNIIVNGENWNQVFEESRPVINIDGMIKIYGSDDPVQYNIPNGTQIDYQKLYEVIYNAIIDATPVSQQTINNNNTYYYNNNYYSPTIINNYGSDGEGDEDDFIDALLTWAVIPEFDTALLVPLEEPLLNGEKIFITSVQVFPNDILMVIGAAFVLVLFAAFINRLIE